jgi:hypothetical protein
MRTSVADLAQQQQLFLAYSLRCLLPHVHTTAVCCHAAAQAAAWCMQRVDVCGALHGVQCRLCAASACVTKQYAALIMLICTEPLCGTAVAQVWLVSIYVFALSSSCVCHTCCQALALMAVMQSADLCSYGCVSGCDCAAS